MNFISSCIDALSPQGILRTAIPPAVSGFMPRSDRCHRLVKGASRSPGFALLASIVSKNLILSLEIPTEIARVGNQRYSYLSHSMSQPLEDCNTQRDACRYVQDSPEFHTDLIDRWADDYDDHK